MRARPMRMLAAGLLAAAALAALALGLSSSGKSADRAAPALPRESLSGPPITLAGLLAAAHGGPALVVFWASWCTSCAQEAPALERFYRSGEGRGRMVGVDWSDPETGAARAFIRRYHWTFPILRDAEGAVGNDYGLGVGLPDTFVLDARGRIRAVLHGPQSVSSLRRALAAVALTARGTR
ncbi:MAG TPA: TlpA disulfide reductase family protein [Solirubrobacteraceae bacterium]|nr:TlpA disulfide reductase family protein [Solirubrobacteraceae bacterium]